jgi:hypothetical protein
MIIHSKTNHIARQCRYPCSSREFFESIRTLILFKEVKGKSVPLQAWSGPEGSRKLRFPDYMSTAQDGGTVGSPTHRPHLPPRNTPDTHFC